MATAIPSIACLGVIGRNNNPLHMTLPPPRDGAAPLRTPLEFSLLLASAVDVLDARAARRRAAAAGVGPVGDAALLHAVDDRLALYGFETNTGVRLLCLVDMRGRPGPVAAASASASAAAAAAPAAAAAAAAAAAGLRDAELKPVFRAMQAAYVRLLQNPFFDPDLHTPLAGRGGKAITSRRFAEEMRRIAEAWAPGVASL